MCINVTLPHDVYNSFVRFTTERPEDGNWLIWRWPNARHHPAHPAPGSGRHPHRRGRQFLRRVFATLIAGADPRVKAGMSFFTSGEHKLGTNYPQFTQLRTTDEVGIWSGTIDPAWRLKRKAVPFLWGVASNDHWAHMPRRSRPTRIPSARKRLAIAPNWYHAFPANLDQELVDWFDIYLMRNRKPYNKPSALEVKNVDGSLTASWSWTGDNPAKKAELLVAYGRTRPGMTAGSSAITMPSRPRSPATPPQRSFPYPSTAGDAGIRQSHDDRDVITSTEPITLKPEKLRITQLDKLNLNTSLVTVFSAAEMEFVSRHGEPAPA